MNTADDNTKHSSGRWQLWDAVFGLGLLGLAPVLWLLGKGMWAIDDLKFFPLLVLSSVTFIALRARSGACNSKGRAIMALVSLVAAAGAALAAALTTDVWWGGVALVCLLFAWMLARFGENPWYQIGSWLTPLVALLAITLMIRSNVDASYQALLASSSSSVLDMFSTPNLPSDVALRSESFELPMERVASGIGSPYLLFAVSLLLFIAFRCKPLLAAFVLALVPLWAWFANTLFCSAGLYLFEQQDVFLFTDRRFLLFQAGVLLLTLGLVWCTYLSLSMMFAPFTAYSTTSSDVHKLYNKAVYFPMPDPLRKRRDAVEPWNSLPFWSDRRTLGCLALCALATLISGGLTLANTLS